jgi:hypothetical protein
MRGKPWVVLVLSLVTLTVAGCGGSEEPASGTNTSTIPAESALPTEVAEKRDAIVSAAKSFDYDRLETLLDPKKFSYSFGESGDPVGYWRRLEEEGHVPILGDYLPVVFGSPHAMRGDVYVWPSAYGKKPAAWTEADRQALRYFYTEEEIKQFEKSGDYLGYRAGIRKDGTWLFFVAGD